MAVATRRGLARAGRTEGGADVESGAEPPALRSAEAAERLLLEVVQRHADELLRVARANSLCADDAHDAYQRSLEQFVRSGRRLERATAHKWLFVVLRNEARTIRAARAATETFEPVDAERLVERHEPSPEERALDADAMDRGALALRALKPQEVRALWLRADGRSYAEIQAATGWTYTKVNRNLREGRRAFLRRCAELEAGAACAPWSAGLAALAAGEAGAAELVGLRPHLRRCPACRATLRGLHASSASMAGVLPPGLVGIALAGQTAPEQGWADRAHALVTGATSWLGRAGEALLAPVHERAVAGAASWQAALEAASSGKVAAVAASTVALAGGGVAAVRDASAPPRGEPRAVVGRRAAPAPRRAGRAGPGRLAAVRVAGPGAVVPPVLRPSVPGHAAAGEAPAHREFAAAPPARDPARSEFAARHGAVTGRAARAAGGGDARPRTTPRAPAGTEFAPARSSGGPAVRRPVTAPRPAATAPPRTARPTAGGGPGPGRVRSVSSARPVAGREPIPCRPVPSLRFGTSLPLPRESECPSASSNPKTPSESSPSPSGVRPGASSSASSCARGSTRSRSTS